jgi:hypothetical protein
MENQQNPSSHQGYPTCMYHISMSSKEIHMLLFTSTSATYSFISKPYNNTWRITCMEHYASRVHISISKVMTSISKPPITRALHMVSPTLLLQDSNELTKLCTPLGLLSLHEHCHNPSILDPTPSLHASIQTTMCCIRPNALLYDENYPPPK